VRRGVEMDLEGFEKALEKVFTANGEWPELRDYVKQVVETARRVQRGETDTKELEKAVDELFRAYGARAAERFVRSDRLEDAVAEMHEGMRRYAREAGLKIGRWWSGTPEAAGTAGLSRTSHTGQRMQSSQGGPARPAGR
jgi:hypothetical protein